MITLKQIEAFYWVGTLGSFSAAADRLNIAQSTVSKRIQELEERLQAALFERTHNPGRLTRKGSRILPLAEEMLRIEKRLRDAVGSAPTFTGTFRIGVTELVAITWLPRLILGVRKAYPDLTLEPQVDMQSALVAKLRDRRIDLMIGPAIAADDQLVSLPLAAVEQAWMCSPDLYRGSRQIPLRRIADFPLLMQSPGSGLQVMVASLLRENGVKAKQIVSCNGMMALAKLAESGFGITCLPKGHFGRAVEAGRLQILTTAPPLPHLEFVAAYRGDSADGLGAAIAAIAASVCDFNVADFAPVVRRRTSAHRSKARG